MHVLIRFNKFMSYQKQFHFIISYSHSRETNLDYHFYHLNKPPLLLPFQCGKLEKQIRQFYNKKATSSKFTVIQKSPHAWTGK